MKLVDARVRKTIAKIRRARSDREARELERRQLEQSDNGLKPTDPRRQPRRPR